MIYCFNLSGRCIIHFEENIIVHIIYTLLKFNFVILEPPNFRAFSKKVFGAILFKNRKLHQVISSLIAYPFRQQSPSLPKYSDILILIEIYTILRKKGIINLVDTTFCNLYLIPDSIRKY